MYYLAREFTEGMSLVSTVPYDDIDAARQAAVELWRECNGAKGAPYAILRVVAQEILPEPEPGMRWSYHGG